MRLRFNRQFGVSTPQAIDAAAMATTAETAAITATTPATVDAPRRPAGNGVFVPPELGAHQFLLMLLYVAAELEHALMVQYLYAGYSLADHLLKDGMRKKAGGWRDIIFTVAKEEMGHLMTVQNLLRCLGGPLNFDREDYPWDPGFHAFPFCLEPLNKQVLARYVVAESPKDWDAREEAHVRGIAAETAQAGVKVNRIGELYALIGRLLDNKDLIPDELFRSATLVNQATPDEWARGYARSPRAGHHVLPPSTIATPDPVNPAYTPPKMLIVPVGSREEAIKAVKAVAEQGEAAPGGEGIEASHFARFKEILAQWEAEDSGENDVPQAFPLAKNPAVAFESDLQVEIAPAPSTTQITDGSAKDWASLFNVRYRLLLTCLAHTFEYPNNLDPSNTSTPRGLLINSTFGEMYNLRAIARILTNYSIDGRKDSERAGPPFQMPFTLKRSIDAIDRWQVHLDLLAASKDLADKLLADLKDRADKRRAASESVAGSPPAVTESEKLEVAYLNGLKQCDRGACELIKGLQSTQPRTARL